MSEKVTVTYRWGSNREYDSLYSALDNISRHYGFNIDNINRWGHVGGWIAGVGWTSGDGYLIKDFSGKLIPRWKILGVWDKIPATYIIHFHSKLRSKFKFRDGPVQGIRCWKPYGRNNRKGKARLFQAYKDRHFLEIDEDLKEYKFKRRTHTNRFSNFECWDCRHEQEEKNWKSFRKTRWK